ncbi:hypothetical protein PO909_016069 [Leuciscus waleckii]
MDPLISLFCLSQGNRSIEEYVEEFCELCHGVDLDDAVLKDGFRYGLEDMLKYLMPDNTPQWTLCQYIEFALRISGSSFSVGPVDEGSHELITPLEPEFCYTSTDSPDSCYVLAEFPKPSTAEGAFPETVPVTPTIKLVTGSVYYRPGLVSSVADSPLRSVRVAIRAIVHESRPAESILHKSCFAETFLPEYLPAEPALHTSPAEPALHARSAEAKALCVMPAAPETASDMPAAPETASNMPAKLEPSPLVPSSTEPSSPLVPSSKETSSSLVPSSTEPSSPLVPSSSEPSSSLVLPSSKPSPPLVPSSSER